MRIMTQVWMDDKHRVGIMEREDGTLGNTYHPIEITDKEKREFSIIENKWFTTYNGARQFFRHETNDFIVQGRMKKVDVTIKIETFVLTE
ncbi:hypothetical protein SAMN05421687_102274 [Salimicrobium flavidum]|uniref:Uncharacterized protein n=2 Tax=Salimicrobium flavidum TaxID=570947 RepID=A0A1N7IV57_9BACI|nr:hypothetical protein SAMN05421687_102274 [Salimicrobium flavidum]